MYSAWQIFGYHYIYIALVHTSQSHLFFNSPSACKSLLSISPLLVAGWDTLLVPISRSIKEERLEYWALDCTTSGVEDELDDVGVVWEMSPGVPTTRW